MRRKSLKYQEEDSNHLYGFGQYHLQYSNNYYRSFGVWPPKPRLRPQQKCGKYFIDFAIIRKHTKLAIELDGFAYHERTKEQFNYEKKRERYRTSKGYTIIRLTWQDVFSSDSIPIDEVFTILEQQEYKILKAKG